MKSDSFFYVNACCSSWLGWMFGTYCAGGLGFRVEERM